jgi:hypothetical protein
MNDLLWVVQEDLFVENKRYELMRVLEQMGVKYQPVSISVPTYDIVPDVHHDGPIITNGSIMLSHIANERCWRPGSDFNQNFSYNVWFGKFKPHLLNKDATFSTLKGRPTLNEFFIRPMFDEKAFTGRVMKLSEYDNWKKDYRSDLTVIWASVKPVGQEHRHFIVDGKVISSSRYKLNGKPNFSSQVDQFIIDFANKMCSIWTPSRMFVLDTYVTGDEIGIVELGCFGHAGFYETDIQKIVHAVNQTVGF